MKQVSFWRDMTPILIILLIIVGVASIWDMLWLGLLLVCALLLWRLSGHYRELNHFALWLMHPVSQNVPSGHGVWTDIFAQLYALRRMDELHEAQLAEWLARFQNTMRRLPDGVLLMDKASHLEWCNPVAEQHFEIAIDQDKDKPLVNFVRVPELVEFMAAKRYDVPTKITYLRRILKITLIDFEADSMILVSRDITETEKVDAMRRDFIANASHELRTPLTVITGFLEYAKEATDTPPEQQQQQIALMHRQAEHMNGLVQDMLMLSRLESDVKVEDVDIDMARLLEQQIHQAKALSNGQHQFKITLDATHVRGSEQEISSVISNLLSNAVRYTPAGGTIELTWAAPVLTVKDSGLGIGAEHIPRLTERFYRVNKDQSRATKGTGLGLAIVKHVLIRHEASLHVESSEGLGSTFAVTFPSARVL